MALASKPSANEPAKDLVLVHTVNLRPMIKAQISERMVSIGISEVAITSVYSEKTHLKKSIIIGERAKRARHSQVCSIENRGYMYSTCKFCSYNP